MAPSPHPVTSEDKPRLRAEGWGRIREAGAARFPGVEGRIPNFVGAEAAAERLARTDLWQHASVLKCNPDSPQRPVRHRALKDGKLVLLAVPKLATDAPFLLLDPRQLNARDLWRASSVKGATELGTPIGLEDLPAIDLVVTGCVACSRGGARLGKGGGYSDLEFAMLLLTGHIDREVPVVTTVHDCQVLPAGSLPMDDHDVPFDLVVTPTETISTHRTWSRPGGLYWDRLPAEKIDAIPVLAHHPQRPR
jgi:5-formyltetrahydrofolate cyclo-ligase